MYVDVSDIRFRCHYALPTTCMQVERLFVITMGNSDIYTYEMTQI